MMRRPSHHALLALTLLLAGCGSADDRPGDGGMSEGENARLQAAAERLETRAPSPAQASAAALEQQVADGMAREQAASTER